MKNIGKQREPLSPLDFNADVEDNEVFEKVILDEHNIFKDDEEEHARGQRDTEENRHEKIEELGKVAEMRLFEELLKEKFNVRMTTLEEEIKVFIRNLAEWREKKHGFAVEWNIHVLTQASQSIETWMQELNGIIKERLEDANFSVTPSEEFKAFWSNVRGKTLALLQDVDVTREDASSFLIIYKLKEAHEKKEFEQLKEKAPRTPRPQKKGQILTPSWCMQIFAQMNAQFARHTEWFLIEQTNREKMYEEFKALFKKEHPGILQPPLSSDIRGKCQAILRANERMLEVLPRRRPAHAAAFRFDSCARFSPRPAALLQDVRAHPPEEMVRPRRGSGLPRV